MVRLKPYALYITLKNSHFFTLYTTEMRNSIYSNQGLTPDRGVSMASSPGS